MKLPDMMNVQSLSGYVGRFEFRPVCVDESEVLAIIKRLKAQRIAKYSRKTSIKEKDLSFWQTVILFVNSDCILGKMILQDPNNESSTSVDCTLNLHLLVPTYTY